MNSDKLEIVASFLDETSGPLATLSAKLEALTAKVDELNATMSETGEKAAASAAKAGSALDTMQSKLGSFSSAAKGIGNTLTMSVTAPIVGIGVAATKMAMDFQQQMEILHTQAGVPQAALAGLGNSILDLAGKVGFSPTSLAEAMYHIESNGKGLLTAAQAMDQLKVSAEAAAMSGANLDDTTYTLSSTLASGVTGAKGYADMMGVLNGIVGAGDMRFQNLNAAIGTGFLATGAQFGITIQSMGAALATLTDNGESAEEAATRLRMSVTLMDAPSAQAAKVLNALGLSGAAVKASTQAATDELAKAHVTTTKLADDMRKPDGLNVALEDLQSHLEKSGLSADAADAAIAKAFGGGRSDAAILTLLNNTKRTGEAFDQINKSQSRFASDAAAQQAVAQQKFKDSWGAIQADLVRLGTAVMPAATKAFSDIADKINMVTARFQRMSPAHQDMLLKFAAYAAIVGPALVILGTVASSLSNIITLFKLMGPAARLFGNIGVSVFNGLLGNIGLTAGAMANLRVLMMTPIPLVVVAAAALAILATVAEKAGEVRQAMEGLTKSESQFNQVSSGLAAAAAKLPNGPEKTKMLAIANQPAPAMPAGNIVTNSILGSWLGLSGYATGGMVPGAQGEAQLAVVHGGEVITPPGERFGGNANSIGSMPGNRGGGVTINATYNVYTQFDEEQSLRDLAWRLAGAQ